MDDTTTSTKTTATTSTSGGKDKKKKKLMSYEGDECGLEDEECDVEAWDKLSKSFKQAQVALDQNRDLIRRVNANHQSKNHDNIAQNVSLICEINGNISKVINIYSDLSNNFTNVVHQRRRLKNESNGDSNRSS